MSLEGGLNSVKASQQGRIPGSTNVKAQKGDAVELVLAETQDMDKARGNLRGYDPEHSHFSGSLK